MRGSNIGIDSICGQRNATITETDKGGFFSKVNEFEFPAKIKSEIVKNWRVLEKKF